MSAAAERVNAMLTHVWVGRIATMGEQEEDDPPRTLVVADGADGADIVWVLSGAGFASVSSLVEPADAVRTAAADPPDLVVVVVPVGSAGPPTVAALVDAAPLVPVLALLTAAEPAAERHATVLAVVGAGATSVVLAVGELPAAARRTATGASVFSPGLADLVLESVSPDGNGAASRLTEREADVLRLIVDGLTARQIATRLVLSPRTVENHVQNMLRKLRLTGRAALVRYAIENGLA